MVNGAADALAFRRFCGLRRFASWVFHCSQEDLEFDAKRRKPQKVGHFSVQAFRGRAPAAICNRRQDTLGPLIPLRKRNAKTRDHGCVVRAVARLWVSLVASDGGSKRVLFNVE